jgi:hypothetical protein
MIDWPSILIQLPIVAVFIWYSRATNKEFSAALERRDELFEKRNDVLVEAIKANTAATIQLCQSMLMHDTWTHDAVDRMVTKSKSRGLKAE